MPDRVLTETGEEVLSSIRRLVSGEPGQGPTAARAPADGEPLLLTPALRVDSPGMGAPTEAAAPYVLSRRIDTDPTRPPTEQASVGDADALDWQDRDEAPDDGQAVGDADPRGEERAPALRDRAERAPELIDDRAHSEDAALRDLVAQIVREELAGDLGDRITRNVRKLVRREIHRVLSGRTPD